MRFLNTLLRFFFFFCLVHLIAHYIYCIALSFHFMGYEAFSGWVQIRVMGGMLSSEIFWIIFAPTAALFIGWQYCERRLCPAALN